MSTRPRLALRSAPTLLAGAALAVSLVGTGAVLGGPAVSAAATLVNIADPTNPAYVAHVDKTGKLEVGDGSGALTVDGTTALAAPTNLFHNFGVSSTENCAVIATPPAGKALVVRQVRLDVISDPSPGSGQNFLFFLGSTCSGGLVGDVNPSGIGLESMSFDPGVGVPAGSTLSVYAVGSVYGEFYVDGYLVAPSAVPASSAASTESQNQLQHLGKD